MIRWSEEGAERSALWQPESGAAVPKRVVIARDDLSADSAFRLASEGTGLLWRGDFQNARQLLAALARRVDRPAKVKRKPKHPQPTSIAEAFHLHRQAQSQRARTLSMLLIPVDADGSIPLPRAPDWREACREAWGDDAVAPGGEPRLVPLRELLGIVGAHEWRSKGVEIAALGAPPRNRIHPHYGVFSPVRGEYLDLIAATPLPSGDLAFDIGTGTGVIAAVLTRRGVQRIVATETDPRAASCARENIERLGLADRVVIERIDLFPEGRAPLIVCNPPWLPARPASRLDAAIHDEQSRMLRGFLSGLAAHLEPQGEGWLILSDLAEHLGLRSRDELLGWIEAAGLMVLGKGDVKPRHPKAADATDPLHAARSSEVTSLWRLGARPANA
ncbi:MAG: class I SAM-dependent methyltransferase [Burkholderiales bacterium]